MLPTLLATGLLLAASPTEPARAFPAYLLVRGGTLSTPVLIGNTPPRQVRGIAGFIEYVPVATVVMAQEELLPQPSTPGATVYEVAEYWGMMGTQTVASLRWDGATQYSRIHVMPNGDVLWQSLEGTYRGPRLPYQRLGLPAIEVLATAGVPFPPAVRRFDALAAAATLAGCWSTRQRRHLGAGEVGAGLPDRVVLEGGAADAAGARPLRVPSDAGAELRGTWTFSRADMIAATIPGPGGPRTAHLSFSMLPGALRGLVETAESAPAGTSGDILELVRATCP